MKVYNVKWVIEKEEIAEKLDGLCDDVAADCLGVSRETYRQLSTDERRDWAYDVFHHRPGVLDEFLGLPEVIEIPAEITDDEAVSIWLSEHYGYYHNGFDVIR